VSETQSRSTADAVELFLPTHVVPLRSAQRDLAAVGKARCCPRTFESCSMWFVHEPELQNQASRRALPAREQGQLHPPLRSRDAFQATAGIAGSRTGAFTQHRTAAAAENVHRRQPYSRRSGRHSVRVGGFGCVNNAHSV
jgi:hypothetical protein